MAAMDATNATLDPETDAFDDAAPGAGKLDVPGGNPLAAGISVNGFIAAAPEGIGSSWSAAMVD